MSLGVRGKKRNMGTSISYWFLVPLSVKNSAASNGQPEMFPDISTCFQWTQTEFILS